MAPPWPSTHCALPALVPREPWPEDRPWAEGFSFLVTASMSLTGFPIFRTHCLQPVTRWQDSQALRSNAVQATPVLGSSPGTAEGTATCTSFPLTPVQGGEAGRASGCHGCHQEWYSFTALLLARPAVPSQTRQLGWEGPGIPTSNSGLTSALDHSVSTWSCVGEASSQLCPDAAS